MRKHEKGKSVSQNVLSVDLSGPHPETTGTTFRYMLVAVFRGEQGTNNLPFVRGLAGKTGTYVCSAVTSVLAELNSIFGEQLVVRFHTDRGREFLNSAVGRFLLDQGIAQTNTAGYDPKANGRAERYIGILKQQATSYLIHGEMQLTFWYWAVKQAAYMYRAKVLEVVMPTNAPTFGNRVLVRDRDGEIRSFTSRLKEGLFLCWDSATVQGAYVLVQRDDGDTRIIATSGPLPWPKENKEVWKLEEEPEGPGRVWISNEGKLFGTLQQKKTW